MARIARVVVPGYPHHVTQRGNRRQITFFSDQDYKTYLGLLVQQCRKHCVSIWAYCLMPNHVHLVAVPSCEDGLALAIGEAHRRYALRINKREGWRGHLWQERFASFVMDEIYLLAAVRYVELNPVRAGLVVNPGDYQWSSAMAHLRGVNDSLVSVDPLLDLVGSWQGFLRIEEDKPFDLLRKHEKTGRPLGGDAFIQHLETLTGRTLKPLRRR